MAQMLTIPEVVNLLRVPETTIRRWIQQGEFPCTIRNGKPLINRTTLISWAEAKHLRLGSSALGKKGNLVSDNLLAALELGDIHYGLKGEDREAVLRDLPGQLQLNKISPQKLETLLLERESQSSTALGKGVAVPHPRYPLPISKSQSRVDVFSFFTNRMGRTRRTTCSYTFSFAQRRIFPPSEDPFANSWSAAASRRRGLSAAGTPTR